MLSVLSVSSPSTKCISSTVYFHLPWTLELTTKQWLYIKWHRFVSRCSTQKATKLTKVDCSECLRNNFIPQKCTAHLEQILTHDRSLYLVMWGALAVATEALDPSGSIHTPNFRHRTPQIPINWLPAHPSIISMVVWHNLKICTM